MLRLIFAKFSPINLFAIANSNRKVQKFLDIRLQDVAHYIRWPKVAESGLSVDESAKFRPVEPPLGHYPARVDEKGRLKLPTDIHRYLTEVFRSDGGTPEVFVTTLDARTIRIYPRSVWARNAALLAQETESPEEAEDLAFLANELGASSDIDAQGRLLVPTELRRELKVENQPVWMNCYNDRIDVFGKEEYEERRRRSRENLDEKLRRFARKGLK